MNKKQYIHPEMARQSAWIDLPLLQTIPVSNGTTTGQITKERHEFEEEFEQDVEIGVITGEFEESEYGNLW